MKINYIIESEEKRKKLLSSMIWIAIGLMIGFLFGMMAAGGQIYVLETTYTSIIIVMLFAVCYLYLTEWSVPKEDKDGVRETKEVEA